MRGGAPRLALSAALLVLGLPAGATAQEWWLATGWYGLKGRDEGAAVLDGERRFDPLVWGVFPLVGLLATSDGAVYPRAGFGRRFPLGERWDATITFAGGPYFEGNGKDLGHTVEFRSALDVGYRLRRGPRLGLAVAHLSNASLSEDNPGVETLAVTVGW